MRQRSKPTVSNPPSVLRRAYTMPMGELFQASLEASRKMGRAFDAWQATGLKDTKKERRYRRLRKIHDRLSEIFDLRGGERWTAATDEVNRQNAETAMRKWARTGTMSGAHRRHLKDSDWK